MIWVIEAKALPDFRLGVTFSDGTEGEIVLRDFIARDTRQVVTVLRDPLAFSALRVDMDTVVWDNGFDLAPEFLHAQTRAHSAA
jgi:hypothetical protein